jgi:hypothetical protein
MKSQILRLAFLLAFVSAVAVSATPPAPTSHLQIPFAVSNTVSNGITEVGAIVNVCDHSVTASLFLRWAGDGTTVLSAERHLESWEVWTFNVRDLLRRVAGEMTEEFRLYADIGSRDRCLVGDSFSADGATLSGTLLYSPQGEDRACERRLIRYVNLAGYTGSLVINWVPRPFSGNAFTVVARDEYGIEVDKVRLSGLARAASVPFDDLGLPSYFQSGTLEVECPDHTCYVGAEYYSAETDEHDRAIHREEVPAWGTCVIEPRVPVSNCEPVLAQVQSGDLNCLTGESCEVLLKVSGSELLTSTPEVGHEVLSGFKLELLDQTKGRRLYRLANLNPAVPDEGTVKFSNSCSEQAVTLVVTEAPPPPCTELTIQRDGDGFGKVGEEFELYLFLNGSLPVSVFSGLPDGLDWEKVNDFTYRIFGLPEAAEKGSIAFRNACSEVKVPIQVIGDRCEEVLSIIPVVINGTDDDGVVGQPFKMEVEVQGGLEPFNFSPVLLNGLFFQRGISGRTFQVAGVPTESGRGLVKIAGQCGSTAIEYEIRPLTCPVGVPPVDLEVIDGDRIGQVGEFFDLTVQISGGQPPYTTNVKLVEGLKYEHLKGNRLRIYGIPLDGNGWGWIEVLDLGPCSSARMTYDIHSAPKWQGCNADIWRNNSVLWETTGLKPSDDIDDVFGADYWAETITLQEALQYDDGIGLLMRESVAALLNALHKGVNYPESSGSVIFIYREAVETNDPDWVEAMAHQFKNLNNLGCPLKG